MSPRAGPANPKPSKLEMNRSMATKVGFQPFRAAVRAAPSERLWRLDQATCRPSRVPQHTCICNGKRTSSDMPNPAAA